MHKIHNSSLSHKKLPIGGKCIKMQLFFTRSSEFDDFFFISYAKRMGFSVNLFSSLCDNVEGLQNHSNIQNIENRCILIAFGRNNLKYPMSK